MDGKHCNTNTACGCNSHVVGSSPQRTRPVWSVLGQTIKEYRTSAKISQEALAKMLGYRNGQLISNIERGLCPFPAKRSSKLCAIIGMPFEIFRESYLAGTWAKLSAEAGVA